MIAIGYMYDFGFCNILVMEYEVDRRLCAVGWDVLEFSCALGLFWERGTLSSGVSSGVSSFEVDMLEHSEKM